MIYLKKTSEDKVTAYGDEHTMLTLAGGYDIAVSEEEWNDCLCEAHVEDGEVVLGASSVKLAEIVREDRDALLLQYCDRITTMRWNAMTDDKRQKWMEYRQALLDIPQRDGFPWDGKNVPWPEKPED